MSERDEGGQVLLLTGILLAIAFIIFSVQLSLVANIGQQAGREARNPVLEDYLLMRRTLQTAFLNEMVNETAVVVCPDDPGVYGGRVESLMIMLTTHEQNRGHAMTGRLAAPVDVNVTAETVTVVVDIYLTDGSTTVQDTLQFKYACKPTTSP